MRQLASTFRGQDGVVLHIGDALVVSPHYGQYARFGRGHSAAERAMLKAFHVGTNNDRDGYWLARTVRYDHHGSYTASDGLKVQQLLHGGRGSFPRLAQMLAQHRPQIVVLRMGQHDVSAGVPYERWRADMERAVDLILAQSAICILSTSPPHPGNRDLGAAYNRGLREMARERTLPLIDFEQELLTRRPHDWEGTLVNRNDLHPTAIQGDATPAAEPTPEHLRGSGYLLLGWLTVQKLTEVHERVLLPGRDS
jgi:hypothetical protein